MPQTAEMRARYPKDWKLRSRFVRLVRSQGKCEWCGVANYSILFRPGKKPARVVLTAAHIHDQRPEKASLLNLAALCQRCHVTFDKQRDAAARRELRRQGQLLLFPIPRTRRAGGESHAHSHRIP